MTEPARTPRKPTRARLTHGSAYAATRDATPGDRSEGGRGGGPIHPPAHGGTHATTGV